jgi:hypothetical protein
MAGPDFSLWPLAAILIIAAAGGGLVFLIALRAGAM